MKSIVRIAAFFSIAILPLVVTAASPKDVERLSQSLAPFIDCFAGKSESYSLSARVDVRTEERNEVVSLQFDQSGAESLRLEIKHKDYWVQLQRRPDRTALVLPLHKTAIVGSGTVSGSDTLAPRGLAKRLVGPESLVGLYIPLVTSGDAQIISLMLTSLLNPSFDESNGTWSHRNEYFLRFDEAAKRVVFESPKVKVQMQMNETTLNAVSPIDLARYQVTEIERTELEWYLTRGIRRAFDVLAPSPLLTSPLNQERRVRNGQLRWIGDQRLVLLHGTPDQIGTAHGLLLKAEADRCVDSVLGLFGTFQTIRSGRWFPRELRAAYERLAPYIPDRHEAETVAMAKALKIEPELAQIMNVFPELFHCSGFAVFGRATKEGKLYHGRVLDYMTTIGLQDAAATFVIAPEGQIPFVTVGYAGFVGSVSGMNAKAISLGEMGGRGEGQWDGVPMATLMRRALEECSTLEEAKSLWKNSPRTCEYYYVFADGKTNEAVGVAATPDAIEFVVPGQSHPLLGEGIADAVLLSSGSRLETLRARVQERYGQIDADVGQWLMSQPVAMTSNLHNVLFVPAEGVLFVANADHRHPAAERPYVRLNLHELIGSMPIEAAAE